jgi:hypothetical protein
MELFTLQSCFVVLHVLQSAKMMSHAELVAQSVILITRFTVVNCLSTLSYDANHQKDDSVIKHRCGHAEERPGTIAQYCPSKKLQVLLLPITPVPFTTHPTCSFNARVIKVIATPNAVYPSSP